MDPDLVLANGGAASNGVSRVYEAQRADGALRCRLSVLRENYSGY